MIMGEWIEYVCKKCNCNLSSGYGATSPFRELLATWIIPNTFASS